MKLKKTMALAWNILIHSKLRSWLTIIGIVIGIASVIAILSMSTGAQDELETQLSGLGADLVTVSLGASRAMGFGMGGGMGPEGIDFNSDDNEDIANLTKKEVLALKTVPNVLEVMGTVSGNGDLKYNAKTASVSITGVDEEVWKEITTEETSEGRLLNIGDKNVIVIGDQITDETFDGIELNRQVEIEGKSFKIVGIIEDSRSIYMPIDAAREVLEDVGDLEFDSITIKLENIDDEELFDTTLELIESKLMLIRGILNKKDKDFSISNAKSMQETMSETMNSLALFLGAIAAISLLVGAIGIANTMFTSVLEKTREIGIMKAIGAKNKDILLIFLLNSGMIGLVGGIGGGLLGMITSSVLSSMISGQGMGRMFGNASVSFGLLFAMLLFSILIGMIAGAIPAYRASKMKPVDALRYE
jgi:putative ABC transport system permease protein